jgi:hypothetical protein
VVVACRQVAKTAAEMAMGRMPTVEARHLSVFEALCLRTGVVAVHGIAAAAAVVAAVGVGVTVPIPVEIVGAREMQRANGGFRCWMI